MDAIDLSSESDDDNEFLYRLLLIRKASGKKIGRAYIHIIGVGSNIHVIGVFCVI